MLSGAKGDENGGICMHFQSKHLGSEFLFHLVDIVFCKGHFRYLFCLSLRKIRKY